MDAVRRRELHWMGNNLRQCHVYRITESHCGLCASLGVPIKGFVESAARISEEINGQHRAPWPSPGARLRPFPCDRLCRTSIVLGRASLNLPNPLDAQRRKRVSGKRLPDCVNQLESIRHREMGCVGKQGFIIRHQCTSYLNRSRPTGDYPKNAAELNRSTAAGSLKGWQLRTGSALHSVPLTSIAHPQTHTPFSAPPAENHAASPGMLPPALTPRRTACRRCLRSPLRL